MAGKWRACLRHRSRGSQPSTQPVQTRRSGRQTRTAPPASQHTTRRRGTIGMFEDADDQLTETITARQQRTEYRIFRPHLTCANSHMEAASNNALFRRSCESRALVYVQPESSRHRTAVQSHHPPARTHTLIAHAQGHSRTRLSSSSTRMVFVIFGLCTCSKWLQRVRTAARLDLREHSQAP